MATFTTDAAIAILKGPKDPALTRAILHENRLELHTEATIEEPSNVAFINFIERVKNRIPDDKFNLFKSLIEYPIQTVSFTDSIFTQVDKVFHSDNAFKKITFKNRDFTEAFEEEIFKSDVFYKTEGVDAMKNAINSILVIDLPEEQNGAIPEPFSFLLPIQWVEKIGITSENFCEYLAFDTGKRVDALGNGNGDHRVLSFIDSESYRMFVEVNDTFTLINDRQSFHGLGYTPAKPFWNEFLARKVDRINKNAPISKQLGLLDQLLFKEISKEHSDLFSLYPMIWNYPGAGNTDNPTEIDYNSAIPESQGDLVPFRQFNSGVNASGESYNKKLLGPGGNIEVPLPTQDQPDLSPPGGFIEPQVDNLKFVTEDINKKKEQIWISTLGTASEPKNDQAKNEKQILSGVESRGSVLMSIKKNFEVIQKFDLITKARLIYGPEQIIDCTVDFGNNFFFLTPSQMEENIKISEMAGMPWFSIEQQRKDAIINRYRNNPSQLRRQEILKSVSSEIIVFVAGKGIEVSDNFDEITSSLINIFETKNNIKVESIDPELPVSAVVTIVFVELLTIINQGNIYGRIEESPRGVQDVS